MTQELIPGLFIRGFTPPLRQADFKLVAFDRDSTLISIKCIDEIAGMGGRKAEVAENTEATLRDDISDYISDYKESLRRPIGTLLQRPWGDVVEGAEKRRVLLEVCELMAISTTQTIAVGEGVKDLPMMTAAGLSMACHHQPAVREQAMVASTEGGMGRVSA